MRVNLSRRAIADIRRHFQFGVRQFGATIANKTFSKIDDILHVVLPANPRLGRHFPKTRLYRYVVARTPFVIYYRIEHDAETLTIIAIIHGAQNRAEFEPD